jgi:hypothetical protein
MPFSESLAVRIRDVLARKSTKNTLANDLMRDFL